MFDDALADKMTAAGGIGLTQMFAKQLSKDTEVAAPATPAAQAAIPRPGAIANLPSVHDQLDPAILAAAPHFVLPVAGRASSGYGLRTDPVSGGTVNHPGFDLAAVTGTQVTAAARGTVVHAGPGGTYGNLVTVRHDSGFETRYAHLSAVDVKVGDAVEAGQDVGKVGTTGYSTGPHLHFEVRRNGVAIDPAPFLPLHSSTVRTTR
jgi:murein DD-endopeptidase MepM/ murein hydrolase activator NlpD